MDRYVWEINYPRIVIYAQKGFASMEELRYCPLLDSVVTISRIKTSTHPMGACGKTVSATPGRCRCEEKCRYTYECMYSSEGKTFDPKLDIVKSE